MTLPEAFLIPRSISDKYPVDMPPMRFERSSNVKFFDNRQRWGFMGGNSYSRSISQIERRPSMEILSFRALIFFAAGAKFSL